MECSGRSSAVLGFFAAVYITDKILFDTSVMDKAKNQEASACLRTMVSFWKLADLKISLSFCAGHICSGVDDKVSEPNFNWNLFLTSLPGCCYCVHHKFNLKISLVF